MRLRDMVAAHSRGGQPTAPFVPIGEENRAPILMELSESSVDGPAGEPQDGIAALVRRANHDELTGLANRNWFVTAIEQERSEYCSRPCALFLIDLDGFKAVNDTWGHGAGDAVLTEVGRRLGGFLGHRAIPARFGGDEFAMWISDCTEPEALLLAERLVALLSEPVPGDLGLSVGASVGWVIATDTSPTHALLSRADIALYAVKERGGHGQQMFNRRLAAARVEGRVLQREIRQGMESDQFVAARQAIATMDGTAIGHEILARWIHPRRGQLAPGVFLPAIQAAGKCADFDDYMMRYVFGTLGVGEAPLSTWINLTEHSLTGETVEYLASVVETGNIKPGQIVIEVSEEARTESSEAVHVLEQIAELGIDIAIDDFGAGYSRLAAMSKLPVSFVKIDRQFIDGIAQDRSRSKIAVAVVNLIRAIGAKSVAEGVETEADRQLLQELGCDYMQGYLFHRPELVAI